MRVLCFYLIVHSSVWSHICDNTRILLMGHSCGYLVVWTAKGLVYLVVTTSVVGIKACPEMYDLNTLAWQIHQTLIDRPSDLRSLEIPLVYGAIGILAFGRLRALAYVASRPAKWMNFEPFPIPPLASIDRGTSHTHRHSGGQNEQHFKAFK